MQDFRESLITRAKTFIIKIGSGVIAGEDGLDLQIIDQLVEEVARETEKGRKAIIVTSGAIASGKHRLGITSKLSSMPEKQAAAAIGQGRLMRVYSTTFGKHGKFVGQMLLTASDLTENRKRYLNIRHTILTLLEWNVIPIINENDTVAVDEIKFGDNDNLAAMIAQLVHVDLVINLTSIDGLYTQNPNKSDKALLIPTIRGLGNDEEYVATDETSDVGTGGMRSKIIAARKVVTSGIPYIIANGKRQGIIHDIFAGKPVGTLFQPLKEHLNCRKSWIAFSLKPSGKVVVDDGAAQAILQKGKSLLPSGVVGLEGLFHVGDAVLCVDKRGKTIGRGLVSYGSEEVKRIMGLKTSQIEEVLGHKDYDEIIHRDNMVTAAEASEL
ncbi:MAG: glutamate 5-kinase [Deltaproteobacteria bacterium]|nr:glutamate 5-kinase [Deltaproteobacteria bacterium]